MEGLVFNIQRYSIHDGPGIRTTVFLKGCPLRCIWCQNPEGISFEPELFVNKDRCGGCESCVVVCPQRAIVFYNGKPITNRKFCRVCGRCVEVCPNQARTIVGRKMSVDEVMEVVEKDRVFYDRSGGGVTLSGGEPLAQPFFTEEILRRCKTAGIDTALDTSGYANWKILARILELVDVILLDLKHIDDRLHRRLTGVSNKRILGNAKRIAEIGKRIWIRVPIIPGYNDAYENMQGIAAFIKTELKGKVEQVNLLPYHKLGEAKYERLERELPSIINPPSDEHVLALKNLFDSYGLKTYIGG